MSELEELKKEYQKYREQVLINKTEWLAQRDYWKKCYWKLFEKLQTLLHNERYMVKDK
jgi:hypothetical protein